MEGDDGGREVAGCGNDYVEQFKILAKATSGRATAAIVDKVLNHKQIFVFGEILELENVQKLRGTESEGSLRALEIFAYGVYGDYLREKDALPPLGEDKQRKLRQLTIVQMAAQTKVLEYEALFGALGLGTTREIEDLIIDSVYAGLVQGKLDHRGQRFLVQGVTGRDVREQDIDAMLATLGGWCARSEALLAVLAKTMDDVAGARANDASAAAALEQSIRVLYATASAAKTSSPRLHQSASPPTSFGATSMDVST